MLEDDARRRELRSFLMYLRSKLTPEAVGLPQVRRRRVPGLRREEVAELIGVSEDWYRWFESGRQISVSPRFLATLNEALHLDPQDTVTLYRLAIPELYRAGAESAVDLPPNATSNLTPIRLPSDIDDARRRFDAAREAFLTENRHDSNTVRPRIAGSWERSRELAVDARMQTGPLCSDDSLAQAMEENHAFVDAALPILSDLQLSFGDTHYCVGLADRHGTILHECGDPTVRTSLERVGLVPGCDLSEKAVGTNGVGTVIADRRPLQITAGEHFVEGGQRFSCTGAPIRNPNDDSICGVLVVMSDYRLVRPTLLPAVARFALAIEESLACARPSMACAMA
ncbi:MAG: helix-turn-helix domain-containing protein [Candidatus Eremiobacteraeota bacterium]|nr:helix-turn-helix domain-containing protein [Candidatus Eremiobacteraeota bacterium]